MFISTEKLGLSQEKIDIIVERLWKEREPITNCPDCEVAPGEIHNDNCDISHCLNCGDQTIFEDCCDNVQHDVWTGIWPGLKECYEQKLICYDTCLYPDTNIEMGWCFDLNEWVRTK